MNDKANTATPANATPGELESEFRDGIPSAVGPFRRQLGLLQRIYPEYYVQIITNTSAERGTTRHCKFA